MPDQPFPLPPEREPPRRTEPLVIPVVDSPSIDPWQAIARLRRLFVRGMLDREATTELSAQLMAFDGESSRDVELIVHSSGGPVAELLPLLDVLDLMRAKVNVRCLGAAGTASALVACATGHRQAMPHATLSLRLDDRQTIEGTASDIVRRAEELAAQRAQLATAVARATGQDEAVIAEEMERGATHSAGAALELGLIDEVAQAKPVGS